MNLEKTPPETAVPPAGHHDAALQTAADAAAWSLVALLAFCVLSLLLGAYVLKRREERQWREDTPGDSATAHREAEKPSSTTDSPWVRDPDWWKH